MSHVTLAGSVCPIGARRQCSPFFPSGLSVDLKLRDLNLVWMLWALNVEGMASVCL
jgi:hypothetical protein